VAVHGPSTPGIGLEFLGMLLLAYASLLALSLGLCGLRAWADARRGRLGSSHAPVSGLAGWRSRLRDRPRSRRTWLPR
jgi:hypothetical protein